MFHRKYQKRTKKCDAAAIKSAKEYKYVPELIKKIFEEWKLYKTALKRQRPRPQDHPSNVQSTISHTKPNETTDLVKNKRSRFT